ncbi:hypothetical protein [Neorhizobium sp. NCHU2750]|uniref:hypothetical protein n=1 Tax=Neorhizobium sp. NCHU2750 TaxID=1825976 RepID=UPI000EB7782D|nr:hypothetical protein NCHU2750_15200 [Neorhizobium sp. NCHU2750]
MTDFSQSDWDENDAGNTGTSPNGVAGSYSPSSVAPIIRAIRGASKRSWVRANPIYTTTGTGAAYVLTYVAAPVAYQKGEIYRVFAHADNTGAATMNVNGLGAKSLLTQHGKALEAGMITAGSVIEFVFDATSFVLISNEKSKPTFLTTATIAASGANTATLNFSANSVVRAAAAANTAGGFSVTLRNANNAVVRTLTIPETGSMSLGSDTVWTSGNDGAGSTLDADLLDGQQGTYYLNAANLTGTLANARISGSYDGIDTLTANRIRLLSTSDASETSTAHGLQIGLDTGTNVIIDNNELMARNNGALSAFYINASALGIAADSVYVNDTANIVMHKGNDGAGSGFDADLLDGQQGTYYLSLTNATGTLPNARVSGAYDGITTLSMTGALTITNSAPSIIMSDTTSGSYNTRIIVDSNNWYLQKQADGATAWTTFMQFEMDTTNAYANGSQILTAANHAHLAIGTTAASAQSAIGINSALVGSLSAGIAANGIGSYAFAQRTGGTGGYALGATIAGSNLTPSSVGDQSGSLSGTWRCMGFITSGATAEGSRSLWLRIS